MMKIFNQIFDALQLLHFYGYTHDDIKPANIMLDVNLNATLIDLGYTTCFFDKKTNNYIPCTILKSFRGNIQFSSYHQMTFKSTSPRDDL